MGELVDATAWPDPSAVATRLTGGFLEFATVPEDDAVVATPPGAGVLVVLPEPDDASPP